jgi:hypothetical protein
VCLRSLYINDWFRRIFLIFLTCLLPKFKFLIPVVDFAPLALFISQFKPVNYPHYSVNHKPSHICRVSLFSCTVSYIQGVSFLMHSLIYTECLSSHAQYLYRIESFHRPGYSGTASVLRNTIKWIRVSRQVRNFVRHSSPAYFNNMYLRSC